MCQLLRDVLSRAQTRTAVGRATDRKTRRLMTAFSYRVSLASMGHDLDPAAHRKLLTQTADEHANQTPALIVEHAVPYHFIDRLYVYHPGLASDQTLEYGPFGQGEREWSPTTADASTFPV